MRIRPTRCEDRPGEIPDGVTFVGGVPVMRGGRVIGAVATSGVRAVPNEQVS